MLHIPFEIFFINQNNKKKGGCFNVMEIVIQGSILGALGI